MSLPLFPLGSVLFPGQSVPLRIFEDRYRAMVRDLLAIEDPTERLFVSVAIREGYEVGEYGVQSLYRVGCTVQLTDVEATADGGYDVVGVVRGRFRTDHVEAGEEYAVVTGTLLEEPGPGPEDAALAVGALVRFRRYRDAVSAWEDDLPTVPLPRDPEYLAWTLAALTPLPLPQRQELLEVRGTGTRLRLVSQLLGEELRAMNAVPSLPASEVARTRWSPN